MSKHMRSPGIAARDVEREELGGDDEAADRQHPALQGPRHTVDIRIGRHEDIAGIDDPAAGVHAEAFADALDQEPRVRWWTAAPAARASAITAAWNFAGRIAAVRVSSMAPWYASVPISAANSSRARNRASSPASCDSSASAARLRRCREWWASSRPPTGR